MCITFRLIQDYSYAACTRTMLLPSSGLATLEMVNVALAIDQHLRSQ